jgi:hypothetical protein
VPPSDAAEDVRQADSAPAPKAPLVLHKGIHDPGRQDGQQGCPRWPEHLRLLNERTGLLVPGRCRSTNLCDYCAKLAAVENTEMLWLDALEQGSPTLWLLLTTNVAVWDGERWMRSMEQLSTAVRRRWPEFEYACLIEFTTGYGRRAEGLRRPHGNLFVRGVPVEEREELQQVVAAVWVPRMVERWDRSTAYARKAFELQQVYSVSEDKGGMRGLTRYVGLHFQKSSQSPEHGWRGQRFRASRGYFVRARTQLREEAKRSLADGRRLYKAVAWADAICGPTGQADEFVVDRCLELLEERELDQAEGTWRLVGQLAGVDVDVRRARAARAPFPPAGTTTITE